MLSRLQQLSIDRIDADGFRGNPLLQNRGSSGVHRARYGLHILPELLPLRRLENAVNLEGDRGQKSVFECAVGCILRRHDRTEDINAVPDCRKTNSTIQRERRDVQHVCAFDLSTSTLPWRIEVLQPTVVITLQVDPRWKQEVQCSRPARSAANLRVCVPPKQHRCDHGLPELEGRHVVVGAVVNNIVERERPSIDSASVRFPLVHSKRKTGDRSRDQANASPYRRQLHCLVDSDLFPARRLSPQELRPERAICQADGLILPTEQ